MSRIDSGPLATYNSLMDRHLAGFFCNNRRRRHLVKSGLITRRGEVVSENTYRLSMARKEHKKHVKDLLAQAIVHKALDWERTRQVKIKQKLEEISKIELVRRLKTECNRVGDEDILPLLTPRSAPADGSRSRARSRTTRSDHDDYDRPESGIMADDEGCPICKRDDSSGSNISSRRQQQQQTQGKSSKYPREQIDSRHLYALDNVALYEYNLTLNERNNEQSRTSAYLTPLISTKKPMAQMYYPTPPQTAKSEHRKLRSARGPKKATSLHKSEPPMAHLEELRSGVAVTFKYFGEHLHLAYEPIGDPRHSVLVEQQPFGGNTLTVFKKPIMPGDEFTFMSTRHRGYPFSLTFYVNGVQNSRLSTCCEFKHRPGAKIGGKAGHFGLVSASGGAGPCYKCRAAQKQRKKKKGGSEEMHATETVNEENEEKEEKQKVEKKQKQRVDHVAVAVSDSEDDYDDSFEDDDDNDDDVKDNKKPHVGKGDSYDKDRRAGASPVGRAGNQPPNRAVEVEVEDGADGKESEPETPYRPVSASSEENFGITDEESDAREAFPEEGSIMTLVADKRDIEIADLSLTKRQTGELSDTIISRNNIVSIVLRNVDLGDYGVGMVTDAIRASSSDIKMLNLNMNKISAKGMIAVADVVKEKPCLEVLLLHGNPVGDVGMERLADTISEIQDGRDSPHTLLAKQVVGSVLSDLHAVVESETGYQLRHLDIGDTKVTVAGASHIARIIAMDSNISVLRLTGSLTLASKGWSIVFEALKSNKNLKQLSIDYCGLKDASVELLCDCLKSHRSIEWLDLEGNSLTDRSATALLDLVNASGTLRKIKLLPGNEFSDNLLDKIQNALHDVNLLAH